MAADAAVALIAARRTDALGERLREEKKEKEEENEEEEKEGEKVEDTAEDSEVEVKRKWQGRQSPVNRAEELRRTGRRRVTGDEDRRNVGCGGDELARAGRGGCASSNDARGKKYCGLGLASTSHGSMIAKQNSPDLTRSSHHAGDERDEDSPNSGRASRNAADGDSPQQSGDKAEPVHGAERQNYAQGGRGEICMDNIDERLLAPQLKRSGPILNEFPELARFFRQEKRNERGACIHECAMCSYSTLNKTTLLYHVVGRHLDIKPFVCTQGCGAVRGSYSNMRQHELRSHQIPYYDRNKVSQTPDYFVCASCERRFGAPLNLLRHFLAHHMPQRLWSDSRRPGDPPEPRVQNQSAIANGEAQRRQRVKDLMSIENLTEPSNDEGS
uniref:C2H2-type domain-containing protein n=1 Tax=Erythrolobus australicus TaxID=1077150 RepID=A0A7S1TL73_9RHOD